MLVDGRLSVRIVAFDAKVAALPPVLAMWIFHVHGTPATALPLTLLLLVAVRFGAPTVTVSLQLLLLSLPSMMTFAGSTMHVPPVGFTNEPVADGVAWKVTSNAPVVPAIVTAVPAVHVSTLVVI